MARNHSLVISSVPFFCTILLLTAIIASLAAATPRDQLAARGLEFTPDEFLEHAGAGDLEAVKLFLAAGMDVNARGGRNRKTNVALYEAARNGRADVVQFLIENGAEVTIKNGVGNTALEAAALGGHVQIVKSLVEHGAAIDSKNAYGGTPLMQAATGGHAQIVKLLVAKGADVNAKGAYDLTPLSYAATAGSAESVRVLLDHGAEANVLDTVNGHTALDRTKDPDIIRMLRAAGGKKASELR